MKPVLLIDFGSTYTKLTAVDVDGEEILGTAAAYTTIQTDINDGLENARRLLEEKIGKLTYAETYACSSAAGGLKMIASGLVPELTGEAAKLASLGAGAKVAAVYAFELLEEDLEEIPPVSSITPKCLHRSSRNSPLSLQATALLHASARRFWKAVKPICVPM